MDFLKKLFPMSFKKTETNDFVKRIVIYAVSAFVVGLVVGVLMLLFAEAPIVAALLSPIAAIVEAYCTGGIVIAILVHCNVIKLGE
jgi:putative flippase GtrA